MTDTAQDSLPDSQNLPRISPEDTARLTTISDKEKRRRIKYAANRRKAYKISAKSELFPPKISPKGITQIKMMANGVDAKTALLLTNPLKDSVSRESVSKLNQKFKRYSLTQPSLVKAARNVVKDVIEGKGIAQPDGTITAIPNASNRLAAATMVYDRYEPLERGAAGSGAGISIDKCVMLLNSGSK